MSESLAPSDASRDHPTTHPPPDRASERLYIAILVFQTLAMFGVNVGEFALIWWLDATTHSELIVGIGYLLVWGPGILLGPICGTWVDRRHRGRILLTANLVMAAGTALLAVLVATGHVSVFAIYLSAAAISIAGGFQYAVMTASAVVMARADQLGRVQGLTQTLHGVSVLLSPAIAGMLLSLADSVTVLVAGASLASIAMFSVLVLPVRQPAATPTDVESVAENTYWRDLTAGFAFVVRWRGLVVMLGGAMVVALLFAPVYPLLPALVRTHLGGGHVALAWLQTAFGAGMVTGGVLLGVWGGFQRQMYTTLFGVLIGGTASMTVGLAPAGALYIASTGMLLLGIAAPLMGGAMVAALQGGVPEHLQGRVLTIVRTVTFTCLPVGVLTAGLVADAIGASRLFIGCGAGVMLVGVIGFATPSVLAIGDATPRRDASQTPEPSGSITEDTA